MGGTLSLDRYRELQPLVAQALKDSGCNTDKRIAMWLAQVGAESGGLRYTEELASGSAYNNRKDLGNIYAGDGERFKGRAYLQNTGRDAHQIFEVGLRTPRGGGDVRDVFRPPAAGQRGKPLPPDFDTAPKLLATPRYAFLATVWEWTTCPHYKPYRTTILVWDKAHKKQVPITVDRAEASAPLYESAHADRFNDATIGINGGVRRAEG